MHFPRLALLFSTFMMPLAAAAWADDQPVASSTAPVTHGELPDLVKQTLLNNPDIIMQAIEKLHEKQASDSAKHAQDAIGSHKDELLGDAHSPMVGSSKANMTVVEFFDYHCGYCKHMLPEMTKLLDQDKKVRVIFKEFPILSEDSVLAARAALAVYNIAPEKYFAFHTALMSTTGKFDEKTIMKLAKEQGIGADKLKAEMGKPYIMAELEKNRKMAEDIGIRGTPAIIVGDRLVPGALPYEDLQNAVDAMRNPKTASETPKS
ncbi:MAG: thioredoxin domain-containing protein [Pseudomonadota bacterium]|nr:thioredoxin domain-containing protein [Pseudomonadota bacterium]